MGWFSKLVPVHVTEVSEVKKETEELMSTVAADRALLEEKVLPVVPTSGVHHRRIPTHVSRGASSLSPFAAKILVRAQSDALKDDDERQPLSSPSELFIHTDEVEKRVERIKSIALEKGQHAADKFIHGSRVIPNTTFHIKSRHHA